ncbi:TPA: type VI secretion system lipoprotein TssJ [Pseudomonas aeruginosa]
MRPTIPLLLLCLALAGCSTVGNVLKKTGKVLMNPSIQVGAAEDQPTQVALSLYADSRVNPNPTVDDGEDLDVPEDATHAPALESATGQYAVNLQSQSRRGLMEALTALLNQLETETEEGAEPAATGSLNWPPLPVGMPARKEGASTRGDTSPFTTGLGQYHDGRAFPDTAPHESPERYVSTPVPFKVIQLKDDSVLLNADPSQLRDDLKKTLGSTYLGADDYLLAPGQFKFVNYTDIDEDTRYIAVIADFHHATPQAIKQVFRVEPRGRKYALLVTLRDTGVAITDESLPAPRAAAPNQRTPVDSHDQ